MTRTAAAVALVALCLAGCGSETGEPTVTTTPGESGSASAGPSPSPSASVPSPPEPFDLAAQRRATAAYPAKDEMPAGWIQVDPTEELPQYPGDPVYCGVRLEKETAPGAALHLYEESDAGPYVLQYTYVLPEGVAAEVMADLAPAVADCIEEGRDDDGRVFAAKDAPDVGEESVSVAFVADAGAVSQVTVFRRGDALVAVVGFSGAGLPPFDAMSAIASGVDARLSAS